MDTTRHAARVIAAGEWPPALESATVTLAYSDRCRRRVRLLDDAGAAFLLDLARVPMDTFQLFLATSVLASRFGTLAAAMHMVVLALVGTYALSGRLRPSPARVARVTPGVCNPATPDPSRFA